MDFWELVALAKALRASGIIIAAPLKWKGTVLTVSDLPSGAEEGDVYRVDADGDLYAYTDGSWINIGAVISVDSAMSSTSENPVQNKVIYGKMTSTAEADAQYHLGFYLDTNGDLCQVE